ncbi:hypothetical protein CALVIDRAFT_534417, partial [Calocera viscosa TUFC12733]
MSAALLSPASSMLDAFSTLKSRVFPRRPSPPPPTLPLELIYTILDLLPPPAAWHCRPVCRLWQRYIEDRLSLPWLEGTRIDMINLSGQSVFRIYHPSERDGRHGPYAFPYVRREGRWLVYALHPFQSLVEGAVQRPLAPYLHPLAYLEYAKAREALTPRYTYELRRLQIHIILTHLADGFHTGPTIALRSKWHPRVLQGGRQEGFRLDVERNELALDWRVVYSSMFEGGTQQWGGALKQDVGKRRRTSEGSSSTVKEWRTRRTLYVV